MSVLAERLLAVHATLDGAGIPHAFGGAIALAYCTAEPRGTRDLDVNVFVDPSRANEILDALPSEVAVTAIDRATARRDGQVRVMWGDTPIDLFLDTHPFHREVAKEIVEVPFEDRTIPVLSCDALLVFKAMYNRTRDWADIEAILEAGTADGGRAVEQLRALLGPDDAIVARLAALTE
jgi:hypothetical protein